MGLGLRESLIMSPLSYSDITPGRLDVGVLVQPCCGLPRGKMSIGSSAPAARCVFYRGQAILSSNLGLFIRALQACNPTAGKSQSRSKSCPRQKTHPSEREARA
jgi:hypothetical protein